jgi:hypothetical protein
VSFGRKRGSDSHGAALATGSLLSRVGWVIPTFFILWITIGLNSPRPLLLSSRSSTFIAGMCKRHARDRTLTKQIASMHKPLNLRAVRMW